MQGPNAALLLANHEPRSPSFCARLLVSNGVPLPLPVVLRHGGGGGGGGAPGQRRGRRHSSSGRNNAARAGRRGRRAYAMLLRGWGFRVQGFRGL